MKRNRTSKRGFTAVELVVSLSAGLIIAASAFQLARNATTFFKSEAAIGSAQFSVMLGITRLQADLKRAGFNSSPNVQNDPMLCGDPATNNYPAGLDKLAAIQIIQSGSTITNAADHALSALNGLSPDALIVGGMYFGTERYRVQLIQPAGGSYEVQLQRDDGAYHRTLAGAATAADAFDPVFTVGRFLRLVDAEGRQAYGVIAAFDTAPINPTITLAAAPTLAIRTTMGTCGCNGFCKGAIVNPVVRMRYDLRKIDPAKYPQYQGLYDRSTHGLAAYHKGEVVPDRTELVRIEIDANDQEIDGTLEVLAEYAVDMKFGLTQATAGVPAPTLNRHAIGSAQVYTIADTVAGGGTPQSIRTVQVRFATRAPRRDRDVGIPATAAGALFRYDLGNNLGFTRMRTMTADIQLPNTNGALW